LATTFTYKLDHDLGFAPNPFFGYCTLACCKQIIRRMAQEGDLIVGLAGKTGLPSHYPRLIYWMKVCESLDFSSYWKDARFGLKKPDIKGPKIRKVGDNTYRKCDASGNWEQEISMHNIPGTPIKNKPHIETDTSEDRILIAKEFTYWGQDGPELPKPLLSMFSNRNYQRNHPLEKEKALHKILDIENPRFVVSQPIDWKNKKYFREA